MATVDRRLGDVWGVPARSLDVAAAAALPAPRYVLAIIGVAAASVLAWAIATQTTLTQTALYAVAVGLGVVLYHARFGFASAFRQLVAVGQGRAIRAHMLMLATGSILFALLIANGHGWNGAKLTPTLAPLNLSLIVGAFLFGIGMQIAGACASGTLFSIGGGQTPLILTAAGFAGGSAIGAWGGDLWAKQPQLSSGVSFATQLGLPAALGLQLVAFAAIALVSLAIEARRTPPKAWRPPTARGWTRVVRGSWPLWTAAILIAAFDALVFFIKGSPWGIAGGFTLWGSKAAMALGIHADQWSYWAGKGAQLNGSLLADTTSVMNFGIVIGAFVAAAASGTFELRRNVPWKVLVAALVGGVLLGYGARIAYGCNIGAYLGGIISFSASGWVWAAAAIAGTYAGLFLRPLFGLTNPKPQDATC